jgi:DNA (cytosine-5)-methyltransferase 1
MPREGNDSARVICTGAGGQALGLHAARFDAACIYEQNKNAVAPLKANRALGPVRQGDIADVDFTAYRGKIDRVAGGVPCQPHSSMGLQRGRDDSPSQSRHEVGGQQRRESE